MSAGQFSVRPTEAGRHGSKSETPGTGDRYRLCRPPKLFQLSALAGTPCTTTALILTAPPRRDAIHHPASDRRTMDEAAYSRALRRYQFRSFGPARSLLQDTLAGKAHPDATL